MSKYPLPGLSYLSFLLDLCYPPFKVCGKGHCCWAVFPDFANRKQLMLYSGSLLAVFHLDSTSRNDIIASPKNNLKAGAVLPPLIPQH